MVDKMNGLAFTTALLCSVCVVAQDAKLASVKITRLHIRSDITYRFATTLVSSTVRNYHPDPREITFEVRLPKTAYISNFTMLIDGKLYPGVVKEKEAAKKQYERAKKKGQSAGHVAKAKPRETERFKVTVNVAAQSETHFNLTYQELLQRKLGKYEHVIYIDPGEPVSDMRVDVFIVESREITRLFVPQLRNDLITESNNQGQNHLAVIDRLSPKSAHIGFYPNVAQQLESSSLGISGQFVVSYDVERQNDAGEILAVKGYFVHFFAPKGLKGLSKRMLFILDTSGSMDGRKIEQLRNSMLRILDDLKEGDEFNIMLFSGSNNFWKPSRMYPANNKTIEDAKKFVRRISANGWTNIDKALTRGLEVLATVDDATVKKASMVVFLTDGHPTQGETNRDIILKHVQRLNEGDVAVFSLAFGEGADYELVKKLSAQNHGIARKIYEDSDADLQLKGFYEEISTPLLSNMTVKYVGDSVDKDSITATDFRNFFNGTEVIVAGKLSLSNVPTLDLSITAADSDGNFVIDKSVDLEPSPADPGEIVSITEKLWAYLTIRQLLDKTAAETDPTRLGNLRAEALELSVKYGFVTPLTSMVVTKPDAEELADDNDAPGSSSNGQSASRGWPSKPQQLPVSRSRSKNRYGGGGGGGGGGSYGDSDPHFIVHVKGLKLPLCFDVKGKDGDIYQLVADRRRGVYVNGKVFGTTVKVGNEERFRTYFGDIVILHGSQRLTITPQKIRLGRKAFNWRKSSSFAHGGIKVTVNARKNVTVDISPDITLSVLKHKYKKKHIKFLGIYITNGRGFSQEVSGIMGEFEHKKVTEDSVYEVEGKKRAKLRVNRKKGHIELDVGLGERYNLAQDHRVKCWKVKHDGEGLLDYRAPNDYLLTKLKSTKVLHRSRRPVK